MLRSLALFSIFACVLFFQSTRAQSEDVAEKAQSIKDLIIGNVEVYMDPAIIDPNESARMVCIIKFKRKPDKSINSIWLRTAYDEVTNKTSKLALNLGDNIINVPQDRFQVTMHDSTKDNVFYRNFTLTVTNATASDSGHYVCNHLINNEHFRNSHNFTVSKAVTSFWNANMSANNTVISGHERNEINLNCTVRHTSNHSSYFLGGVFISGTKEAKRVNISNQFSRSVTPRSSFQKDLSIENEAQVIEPSFLTQLYDINFSNNSFKLHYTHNGQYLHCLGVNKKNSYEKVDSVVKLSVTHAPAFKCNTVQKARLYDRARKIVCKVYANPLDINKIYWEFDYGAGKTKLKLGSSKGANDYKIEANSKKQSDGYAIVEIQFARVQKSAFQKYKLVAENKYGKKDITIELKQKISGGSSGNQLAAQFSLLAIVFVVVQLLVRN